MKLFKIIFIISTLLFCSLFIIACEKPYGNFPRIYPIDSYTEVSCSEKTKGYSVKFRLGRDTAAMSVKYSTGLWCPDEKNDKIWYFIGYDEKGRKIDEGKYFEGKQQGLWIGWHKNGIKESELNFEKGMPTGKFTAWHDNGAIAVKGEYYSEWKMDGEWMYTNPQGKLEKIIVWDKGNIVGTKK
jgi:hypothetical protein